MNAFIHYLAELMRGLFRKPGFALAVVLILALGIGANTATLSLLYRYFYAALPCPDAQQLVRVQFSNHYWGTLNSLSLPVYRAIRSQAPAVQYAAVYNWSGFNLAMGSRSLRVGGIVSSASLFSTLGVAPLMGRVFPASSEQPGAEPVIVLSWQMWNDLLHRDSQVIGRTLRFDNRIYTVIGVMPRNFWFPSRKAMFWAPLTLSEADFAPKQIGDFDYNVITRLKPGADISQLAAQANALFAKEASAAAANGEQIKAGEFRAQPIPWRDWLVGQFHQSLLLMQLATALLILLAWFNLANLFLNRALARRGELVLRRVLGADSRRLFGQLLTESLGLCAIGTVAGLLVGRLLVVLLERSGLVNGVNVASGNGWGLPLAVACGLGIVSALVFATVGFYGTRHQDLSLALREGDARASHSRGERRTRSALIVLQVALACALCGMVLLLARSLLNLNGVNLGFQPQHALTLELNLPAGQYPPPQSGVALTALRAKLTALLGISAASISSHVPFDNSQDDYGIFPYPWNHHTSAQLFTALADGGYFRALGMPLLAGRTFSDADRNAGAGVAVIDTLAAKQLFGTTQVLGRQFTIGNVARPDSLFTVIGIVGPVHRFDVGQAPTEGSVYLDRGQVLNADNTAWANQQHWIVSVRSLLPPDHILPLIRDAAGNILPGIPVYGVQTLDQRVAHQLAQRRGLALLVGFFSLSALLLAAVGLYAVQNYSVSQRTREFGIRAAIGADRSRLLRLVLSEAGRLLIIGLIMGLAGMAAMAEVFAPVLYGVSPTDPAIMLIVAGVIIVALMLAAWLPAWRASRIAAAQALRQE